MRWLQMIDQWLIRLLGLRYLRVTRNVTIHQRSAYLAHQLSPSGDVRLLDAGCGPGFALFYVCVGGYLGIDLDTARLVQRYRSVPTPHEFRDVDLDDDWQVEPVDVVWCSEVLEHLVDHEGVLRKIAACLAPGGRVIVTMPSRAFIERHETEVPALGVVSPTQDGGHVRTGYSRTEMDELAAAAGLRVERIDAISPMNEQQVKRHLRGRLRSLWGGLRVPVGPTEWVEGATDDDLRSHISIAAILRPIT